MDEGNRAPDVLRGGGTHGSQENAVFGIPDFEDPVSCLPTAFQERTSWQGGDTCPPVGGLLPCFRARFSDFG